MLIRVLGREVANRSGIGVHQHYTDEALNNAQAKAFTAVDISAEQIIAGILADYIVRMGVDARFLTRASMAGPTEIYKFSSDEMTKFAITWNDEITRDNGITDLQVLKRRNDKIRNNVER